MEIRTETTEQPERITTEELNQLTQAPEPKQEHDGLTKADLDAYPNLTAEREREAEALAAGFTQEYLTEYLKVENSTIDVWQHGRFNVIRWLIGNAKSTSEYKQELATWDEKDIRLTVAMYLTKEKVKNLMSPEQRVDKLQRMFVCGTFSPLAVAYKAASRPLVVIGLEQT